MTGSEPRLLVVDDEPDICRIVCHVAADLGLEAKSASSRDEFQTISSAFNPDVIVLDLQLPGSDGVEILEHLANINSDAQILLISGLDKRVLSTANRLGAAHGLRMLGSLSKPMQIPDLEAALKTAQDVHGTVVLKQLREAFTADDLRSAIASDQLFVEYQPKAARMPNDTWAINSVEALVRWNHDEYGVIPPSDFIPLAEETGLIESITDTVLERTIAQLSDWHSRNMPVSAAVNLSPFLLKDLELPNRVVDLLKKYRVDPSHLTLEITESGAMADVAQTMSILTRFRIKNIQLSMDDFGTGYSSLVQLYRMPFGELKVDRRFVQELTSSEEAQTIVRMIVQLAHGLDLSVCAEGVESLEALDILAQMGCETVQGYVISKPVGPCEFEEVRQQWNKKVEKQTVPA